MGFLDSIPFFRRSAAEIGAVAEPPAASTPPVATDAPVVPEAAPAPVAAAEPAPAAEPVAATEPASVPVLVPEATIPNARAVAEELVRAVVRELPDFVTVAVVERQGGRILAGQWAGHSGGAVEAAAANAELVNQTYLLLEALELGADEQLQDVVITLTRQLHLLLVLPQYPWLLYLAVRSQDTNMALARTVLQEAVS